MKINAVTDRLYGENCYIIENDKGECAVIDPADKMAAEFVKERSLTPMFVLLTHGHFDHIAGLDAFLEKYPVPVYIHGADKDFLRDGNKNASSLLGFYEVRSKAEVRELSDGECVYLRDIEFKTMNTPGHTDGSCCFFAEDAVFSGDTVFAQGYGRTDLYGGDEIKMHNTLKKLQAHLIGKTIYPGHGTSRKF